MFKSFKKNLLNLLAINVSPLPYLITFTGGMGAQMISAAIYFQMKFENKEVYADLSYFDKPKEQAVDGVKGKASHWGWQLESFGLNKTMFLNTNDANSKKCIVIEDGANKLSLALNAFTNDNVNNLFKIEPNSIAHLIDKNNINYLCIHVRRGDYLNVATHLTSDSDFFALAQRLKNMVNHVVVVSDSKIPPEFQFRMSEFFSKATFLDNVNEYESHCIMRSARILVCSNSQFSLVAAILNKSGLIFLPRVWFGKDHPKLEMVVSNLGTFQVLS
jgi:hypothetical protein